MAFGGASLIVDGKLCDLTASPIDARADTGYHLLVVESYSRSKGTPPNGKCIRSRPFLVGGHRWIVEYYPNGDEDDNEEFISVYLRLDEMEGQEGVSQVVEAQCAFSFIDQPELRVSTIIRGKKKLVFSDDSWGDERFMSKELLERSGHLKNDSFVIRCDVVVIKAGNNTGVEDAGTTAPVLVQVPASDMQSHFDNLLLNKEGADIIFHVGGKEFAAHRFVLAARSTVFNAQLFGVMNEGTMPSVGKETDVFTSLLTFIYTDAFCFNYTNSYSSMEEDEADEEEGDNTHDDGADEGKGDDTDEDEKEGEIKLTLNLLEAAVRYDLQKLKMICEEILASRYVTVTSVADIIVVAERTGCRWLKDVCLEFIKSHTSVLKIFTADVFDQIIKTSSPSSLKELLSKFPAS